MTPGVYVTEQEAEELETVVSVQGLPLKLPVLPVVQVKVPVGVIGDELVSWIVTVQETELLI